MATTAEKKQWNQLPQPWQHGGIFRNINYDLSVARQIGFVFDENVNNWYIIVDGRNYWAYDTSVSYEQWADPYKLLGDMNPNNDAIAVFNSTGKAIVKTGAYEIKIDPNGDEYYYNEVGKKIYAYQSGSNPQSDAFIGRTLTNRSDLLDDPNDIVLDILGNAIAAKIPQLGLYDTKQYFEELKAKKAQYVAFYTTKDKTKLLIRAKDIIKQEDTLIAFLNKSGVYVRREKVFMGAVTLAVMAFGIVSGGSVAAAGAGAMSAVGSKFAGEITGAMKSGLQARPIASREQLRKDDLMLLQSELKAIEDYVNKPSDADNPKKKLTALQIAVICLGLVLVVIIWRRYRK